MQPSRLAALLACLLLAGPAQAHDAPIAHALEATFVGLQVADLATTHRAIQHKAGREGNPIMAQPAAAIALKAGVSVLTVWGMERFRQRHPRAAWITLALLDAGYAAVVARNYRIGTVGR